MNVRAYAFYPLLASTTHLTQHLSSLTIFITAFIGIYTNRLIPSALALSSSLVTILAYIFWDFTSHQSKPVNIPSTVKSAGLIFFTLLGLSPVLKSLTKSTTSDSIWALSVGLFVVEIMAHDYSSASWKNIRSPPPLPLLSDLQIPHVIVVESGDFEFSGISITITVYDNSILIPLIQCAMVCFVPVISTVPVTVQSNRVSHPHCNPVSRGGSLCRMDR